MAAEEKPLKGRKVSVWVNGENLREMRARGLSPAEIFRRGLAWHDPVDVSADLGRSVELLVRLASALANGGRVVYPGEPDSPPGGASPDV